ncbi:AMP-binding protein, partial [Allopusillimonas soli]
HMLLETALAYPNAPALRFGQTRLTYREYASAVAGLACQWRALVRPGERVILILPNSLDLVVATYAVHALRAQVVALNPRYTERELRKVVDDADPALLVIDTASGTHVENIANSLPVERCIGIVAGDCFASCRGDVKTITDLPKPSDFASLQYTSGTSGRPKGVNITHRHLAYNLAQREIGRA